MNYEDYKTKKAIDRLFDQEIAIDMIERDYLDKKQDVYDDGYAPKTSYRMFPTTVDYKQLPEMLHNAIEDCIAEPVEDIRSLLFYGLQVDMQDVDCMFSEILKADYEKATDNHEPYNLKAFIQEHHEELAQHLQLKPTIEQLLACNEIISNIDQHIGPKLIELERLSDGFDKKTIQTITPKEKYDYLNTLSKHLMKVANSLADIKPINNVELAGVDAEYQDESLPIHLYQKLAKTSDKIGIDIYRQLDQIKTDKSQERER